MYKSEKTKLYTSIIVLAFFVIAWFFALSMVVGVYKKYKEYSFVLEQESAKLSGAQTLTKILRDTAEDRSRIESMFVAETKLGGFLNEVSNIGDLTGASIELIKLDQEKESISMQYQVKGTFNEVFSSVKAIENMQYYINLGSLSMKRSREETLGDGSVELQWEASVVVELLSFKQNS